MKKIHVVECDKATGAVHAYDVEVPEHKGPFRSVEESLAELNATHGSIRPLRPGELEKINRKMPKPKKGKDDA